MIKKDRISQGEGEILDLKLNSSGSIADKSDFPIIVIRVVASRLSQLDALKKRLKLFFLE